MSALKCTQASQCLHSVSLLLWTIEKWLLYHLLLSIHTLSLQLAIPARKNTNNL